MTTQKDLAAHLDLSQAAVSQLARDEIIPRAGRSQYDLDACRVAYIRHLREIAAGRSGSEGGLSLTDERARLASEQADAQAMKNAVLRGEMVPIEFVGTQVETILNAVRHRLMAMPGNQATALTNVTDPNVVRDALLAEVSEALNELSALDLTAGAAFGAAFESGDPEEPDAAAETELGRMG